MLLPAFLREARLRAQLMSLPPARCDSQARMLPVEIYPLYLMTKRVELLNTDGADPLC